MGSSAHSFPSGSETMNGRMITDRGKGAELMYSMTFARFVAASVLGCVLVSSVSAASTEQEIRMAVGGSGTPEVVGGWPVLTDDWPDCAGVVFGTSVDCTGVLIAPTVVLTAAHCIGGITEVYLSTWDLNAPQGESIAVIDEIAYPTWWSTYDIGLLILENPSATPPRMIAHGCAADFIEDGAGVTVVGWGAIDYWGTVYPDVLMQALTVIDDADCSDPVNGCNVAVSPGGELGAGGNGVDSCYGDSGGPLYLHTPLGDMLVGITSRAYAWVSRPCGDGGIYVRPDAVISWIETTTGITLPAPDCTPLVFFDDFESGDTRAWGS